MHEKHIDPAATRRMEKALASFRESDPEGFRRLCPETSRAGLGLMPAMDPDDEIYSVAEIYAAEPSYSPEREPDVPELPPRLALGLAAEAVMAVLGRIQRDPAWQRLMLHSPEYQQLLEAEAAMTGESSTAVALRRSIDRETGRPIDSNSSSTST